MAPSRTLLTRRRLSLYCGSGQYADKISAKKSECKDCQGGYYKRGTNTETSCKACANGQYSTLALSTCYNCAAGYTSDTPTDECSECSAGYYSTGAGEYPCPSCAEGEYSSSTASSKCTSCAAGYFTGETATTACLACAVGQYAHTPGATACVLCPAGSFSNQMRPPILTARHARPDTTTMFRVNRGAALARQARIVTNQTRQARPARRAWQGTTPSPAPRKATRSARSVLQASTRLRHDPQRARTVQVARTRTSRTKPRACRARRTCRAS